MMAIVTLTSALCFSLLTVQTGARLGAGAGGTAHEMRAAQGTGTPCSKPDWSCIVERTIAVPQVGPGEVLIEMHGTSVNPINVDLVEPSCLNSKFLHCSNGTLGDEGAGIITAVGSGCESWKVGQNVWGYISKSYAQYAVANCSLIGLMPIALNFVDAGTIPVAGSTSLQCLQATGLVPGKNLTVVVTSGQGGTGFIAIQLAKAMGAGRVITAASGDNMDLMKRLGADLVVDYHKQDLFDALPDNSVDIVYDNFGLPGTADKAMPKIRTNGTFLVLMGGNGGKISSHPKRGIRQLPFGMMQASKKDLDILRLMFNTGALIPHTMQPTYWLTEVSQAFTRLRSSGVVGKIAVVPNIVSSSVPVVV